MICSGLTHVTKHKDKMSHNIVIAFWDIPKVNCRIHTNFLTCLSLALSLHLFFMNSFPNTFICLSYSHSPFHILVVAEDTLGSSCVPVTTRDAIAEESYVTDQVTALCHTNEIHIFVREEGGRGERGI